MALSFQSVSKGIGLYDFFQFGKYKGCRVDSILAQDPEYITYTKEKFGTLYAQKVLEQVEGNLASIAKNQEVSDRRSRNAYARHGISALFGSYADNPDYDEDFMLALEDIPF